MSNSVSLFALIAALAIAADATPAIDSKGETAAVTDSGAKKQNATAAEDAAAKSKAASPYLTPFAGYPGYGAYSASAPYGLNGYSQPIISHQVPSLYAGSVAHAPLVGNQLLRPTTASSYYTYAPAGLFRGSSGSASGTNSIGANGEAKTFSHLRPTFYQSQPQIVALPVQTYPQTVHSYSNTYQPTVHSAYYGAGYAGYGGYGGYGDYGHVGGYYKSADDADLQEQADVSYASGDGYATTRYLIAKPVSGEPSVEADTQRMSTFAPRDASAGYPSWRQNGIRYTALPAAGGANYAPIDELRHRDIVVDDEYNMRIQPSYLMDRLRLHQSNVAQIAPSGRSADESTSFGGAPFDSLRLTSSPEQAFGGSGSGGADDQVYVVMNPYEQRPVVAKAAADDDGSVYLAPQPAASFVMAPNAWNGAAPATVRDNGNAPYSQSHILDLMNQVYLNKYNQQMVAANQQLSRGGGRSVETEQKEFYDRIAEKMVEQMKKQPKDVLPAKVDASPANKVDKKAEGSTEKPKSG